MLIYSRNRFCGRQLLVSWLGNHIYTVVAAMAGWRIGGGIQRSGDGYSKRSSTPSCLISREDLIGWRAKLDYEFMSVLIEETLELQSNEAIHHFRICLCKDEAHTSVEPTPELQSNEAIHHFRIRICKDEAHTSVEPVLFMLISSR
ncbi:hypothetical protein Tco_0653279 [Tanacetum coccineum]|uniref:Uncharacterized protein n=1 Tax=Tanacetum coccineum TaxID=301880 RepID=A0ABQ4X0R1_9ASTR